VSGSGDSSFDRGEHGASRDDARPARTGDASDAVETDAADADIDAVTDIASNPRINPADAVSIDAVPVDALAIDTADEAPSGPARALPATFNRLVIGLGFAAYAIALYFAIRRWELPTFDGTALGFLAVALLAELGAKWFFADLFRNAMARQGRIVTAKAAIYASLVGSAVARLLPAGGALTPSAMAWAVRTETDEAAGAALRTAVTSYGGLLVMTGVAMGWGASTGRHPLLFTGEVLASVALTGTGLALLVGSRWLRRFTDLLPDRLRHHFGPTAGGGNVTAREIVLIVLRISLEGTVLWSALWAFGIELSASQAMVAFGISTVVGGLPATPGGVGLVEGGLVGVLIGFGFPAGSVVAPVLVYRIIDYWIAAALGILAASRMTRHVAAGRR
jgi:uncharacterized membrane protein YbhN (UPF0104 family)